ncbi:MAG: histone deacetylase [Candidatus Scalindua sp. AMX11]|nr:MAG: histone deacetylase [Candidatus Scalindua sp.]NOG85620.1 histone deacetylase [Planctomycetota bacterium]RZV82482.1 MAG: histone deacetylase [Candidatus Scalindua sp. SCAELEC01]TDE65592.1 MAG: histone deacetylase [Candidatus Scalindua sp. AMX11]GJQ59213.1 MAG: histone deacetylase [Candidatus Scalindua sp.]
MTTLVYDDIYTKHDTGLQHPENSLRITNTVTYLKSTGVWEKLGVEKPRAATIEEIASVHSSYHIEHIEKLARTGGGNIDPDTSVSPFSYDAASYAAGAPLTAIDLVMKGEVDNAFCLIRPPGHHATPTRAMGFCLFNNVSIAAKYLQREYNLEKVVIIDWDVHHGNGTQDTFYEDPSVLYFSIHRYPFYPGTGRESETGKGRGVGGTINIPLPHGTTSKTYISRFQTVLEKDIKQFRPNFILISSGFDAYGLDPVGGLGLGTSAFRILTEMTQKIARECCEGRIVSCLEGGYHLSDLPRCIEEHLNGLNSTQN